MAKQFRKKLKRMILLGSLLPVVFFVGIFLFKYNKMNMDALKDQFNHEVNVFDISLKSRFENYENALKAHLEFLDKQSFNDGLIKANLYDSLFDRPEILAYYHFSGRDLVYSNQEDLRDENLTSEILDMQDESKFSMVYRKDDPFLYMFYNDVNMYQSILLQVDIKTFLDATVASDEKYAYQIFFKDMVLYESQNRSFEAEKKDSNIHLHGQGKYLYTHEYASYKDLHYTFTMDISREISFVEKHLKLCVGVMVAYFIVAIILLLKGTKFLLKPLDILIKRVSSVAEGTSLEVLDEKMDSEFQALMDKFDDMVDTSYKNMAAIFNQSKIIEEKNTIMMDLNEALEKSSLHIEASTKKLMIYEKQSKILVDNIKDLMWVVDTRGRIIYINTVVEEKLGYVNKDLIGVKLESLLKESIESEEFLDDILHKDIKDVDISFMNKQGVDDEIYVTSTKRVMSNGHVVKIQGVSRDITEERFVQKQLVQKNDISNTLNEISEILTKPEKLEVLLHQIVARIERLLEPYVCTIRLIDDHGRLELKAGIGAFYALVQEKHLDIDKDISGRAIKESKIIIVSDHESGYYDNYEEVSEIVEKSKEIIFLPLEFNDHVIGVMSIGLRENISDSQLKILKVFTNQASAAIEKARMYEELEQNYLNIIKALASTVEAKDAYTEDHSIRVSKYSRMLAETLGLSDEEVGYIDIAGLLHDIGKIGVSDLTLTKKGKLTEEEFIEIKKHPLNGGRIVSEMKLHHYIIDGVLLHHKRFDLKGYPDIYIESLPISARIIGVADAFDAMTSNRSYQNARSFEDAYVELEKNCGTQFCPVVVEAMSAVIKRL